MMRVAVIGTGLVGGSIGLALVEHGHEVVGYDQDADRLARAVKRGAVTSPMSTLADALRDIDVAFIALPVVAVADVAVQALDAGVGLVTDVGSVKRPIVEEIARQRPDQLGRFVGGHPMAGSEQDGIDAARADLFVGATWVLTPTPATDDAAYARLRSVVRELQAEVVTITPEDHDVFVALVSHVPQLASSTLMNVAVEHEQEHRALLQLAAGGFRDMTRIAASQPAMWIDVLTSNRDAVLAALDAYLDALNRARASIAADDRDALATLLASARAARRNLPVGAAVAGDLVEIRIPVPDRPNVIAEVATMAGSLGVNIADLEIAHSMEGRSGVLVMVVAAAQADELEAGLRELGYQPNRTELS